ncbi:hypothetical protein E4U51_008044 [Claviceps purpurea]|nr:hypothetical protein E4U51_008044 [Claviceps purpurea]
MRVLTCVGAIASALLLHSADAHGHKMRLRPPPPPAGDEAMLAVARTQGTIQNGTFQQLLDHKNPHLGTFSQRYWYNAEWWAGPGAPVILRAPDEGDGWDGYVGNTTQSFEFARTNKAAVLTLEHRYYGESSPFQNLTTTNLQHLTLDNAIQDIVYFANNVVLPFDKKRTSSPDKAPWVLTGCSYAGALSAWVQRLAPGTFWAYHCSSAVVEAISDFWQYYEPIEAGMPKNCSSDLKTAIAHIDKVLASGDAKAGNNLKKQFGLETFANNDFGWALNTGVEYWQSLPFKQTWHNPFYDFCDYIENVFPEAKNNSKSHTQLPGPEGVGLNKALHGFARWSNEVLVPNYCSYFPYWQNQGNYSLECFDFNNPQNPTYRDTSVENSAGQRQWVWLGCNEPFEWWLVSGPAGQDTGLVSRFVDVNYKRAMCKNYFPREGNNTYGLDAGRTGDLVNKKTNGWDVGKTERVMWVGGEFDPWRSATVLADRRPGGPLQSTPETPAWIVPKATHCSDIHIKNVRANAELSRIFDEMVAKMKSWVDDFYLSKGRSPPTS